jgi:KUP system potassium uptake protein
VKAKFGYMEDPDVPATLDLVQPSVERSDLSYFLSRVDVVPGSSPTMAPWRKRLFVATSYIAADSAGYFSLPPGRTAIVGARIEL